MSGPSTKHQYDTQVRVVSHENHHQEQAVEIGEGEEAGSDEGLGGGEVTTHVDGCGTFATISASGGSGGSRFGRGTA